MSPEKVYNTILNCFNEGEYITAREVTQILRQRQEVEIATNLPWQVRYLLTTLHKKDVLEYDSKTASYKRKERDNG